MSENHCNHWPVKNKPSAIEARSETRQASSLPVRRLACFRLHGGVRELNKKAAMIRKQNSQPCQERPRKARPCDGLKSESTNRLAAGELDRASPCLAEHFGGVGELALIFRRLFHGDEHFPRRDGLLVIIRRLQLLTARQHQTR